MDPNATLGELIEALENEDWDTAWRHKMDLMLWLEKGGAVPKVSSSQLHDLIKNIEVIDR